MSARCLVWLPAVLAACGGAAAPAMPVDVEVVAPRVTVGGRDLTKTIAASSVEAIRRRPEVTSVVPRAELHGPASARATFEGQEVRFEVGGFADGIPADTVAGDGELAARFVDLDPAAAPGPACDASACPDPASQYCDAREGRCRARVPVIVSPELIELYNARFAAARGLPRLDPAFLELAIRRRSLTFTIELGHSMTAGSGDVVHEVGAILVAVSPRARAIGFTVPMSHLTAWNRALGRGPTTYTSLEVRLRSASQVEAFRRWLHADHELVVETATLVLADAPPAR